MFSSTYCIRFQRLIKVDFVFKKNSFNLIWLPYNIFNVLFDMKPLKQIIEEDILNYSTSVMFRGTLCTWFIFTILVILRTKFEILKKNLIFFLKQNWNLLHCSSDVGLKGTFVNLIFKVCNLSSFKCTAGHPVCI